jgi:hypothetical protein
VSSVSSVLDGATTASDTTRSLSANTDGGVAKTVRLTSARKPNLAAKIFIVELLVELIND